MADATKPEVAIDPKKPVYDCPKCHEHAVQFFRVDPQQPLREDAFICRACGNSWQI